MRIILNSTVTETCEESPHMHIWQFDFEGWPEAEMIQHIEEVVFPVMNALFRQKEREMMEEIEE